MYIKQVIIQGFRSYRDQTVIDPFSPKHNVVVGRNGSGKSNFFLAIQFVLSDEFSHMRQEERQQLLHEGTGPRVVSAYVEVIFDNSDNRIPIDKDEVTLRRVIGSKKDQYFLDKKNITKTDVMNLLESAGFSRSNPYYIVKQGRINQLAVAKDHDRLKLLREVAGTRVYDERKNESQTILKETDSKREKIDDLLKYIEERLETLETEKEELKQYQKWDKERRCLEYTIHDKELKETREKLDKLDSSRQDENEKASTLQKEVQEATNKINELNHAIKDLIDKCSAIKLENDQLTEEHQENLKKRTKLELMVKDLEEGLKEDDVRKSNGQKDLQHLEAAIAKHEDELKEITPSYNEKKTHEENCKSRLKSCEQRRTDLFSKQGRGSQFSSKKERDEWLRREIQALRTDIHTKENQIRRYQNDVTDTRKKFAEIDADIAERSENLEHRKKEMDRSNEEYSVLKLKRDELNNKRKELWRQENILETSIESTRNDLSKSERDLKHTMSKSVAYGIESVKRVVSEKGMTGVYGPLIENFSCSEKFFAAVDVTAGGKLFNIIVDTDKTGAQLLTHINKMKLGGEVTIMPLNRLNFKDVKYPNSPDVLPMISKIEYNELFKPAMQLAFGKTLICRSQDVCSQFSKSHDIDTITLEGDKFSRRGTLEGGYINTSHSRLLYQKKIWEFQSKLEEQTSELDQIKTELQQLDGENTKILSDLQVIETKQIQLRQTYERQKQDVRNLMKSKASAESGLEPKEATLKNYEVDLQSLQASLQSYQDEMGSELLSQLNEADQEEVDRLNDEIRTLTEDIKSVLKERTILEGKKQKLDDLLKSNLYKKREELQSNLEEGDIEDKQKQLALKISELKSCSSTLEKSSGRLEVLNGEMKDHKENVKSLQDTLETWKTTEKEKRSEIEDDAKHMEKIANKRSLLLKKKEESMKKIRELGSLPADAFEKYHQIKTKVLWKRLKDANEELKKYSHVNKKALDQFVNFSEQKEKLIKRKEELAKGYEAILDLMEVLEQRKHEAILFTFKQVSHNFSDIFKQLVPGGKAQLIMKKEARDSEDDSSQSQQSETASQRSHKGFDEFSGISIKVSFTGKSAETLEMNQLSGGQKTLVALTLIFAIQKCDPAPFYLFDEIDQALDPSYRKSVAAMIHDLADKAQFITTTFRPELLESAEKFYGVQFKNKVSHILCIPKEDAKDFVEDDCQETQKEAAK